MFINVAVQVVNDAPEPPERPCAPAPPALRDGKERCSFASPILVWSPLVTTGLHWLRWWPHWSVNAYLRGFYCECNCSLLRPSAWTMIAGWSVTAGVGHVTCSEAAALSSHLLCVCDPPGFIYERVRVFIAVLFISSDIYLKLYLWNFFCYYLVLLCLYSVINCQLICTRALASFLLLWMYWPLGVTLISAVCLQCIGTNWQCQCVCVCAQRTNISPMNTLQTYVTVYNGVLLHWIWPPLVFRTFSIQVNSLSLSLMVTTMKPVSSFTGCSVWTDGSTSTGLLLVQCPDVSPGWRHCNSWGGKFS